MEQFIQFVINHWALWLLFVVVLLLTILNEILLSNKKTEEISPQTAIRLINNDEAVVIDTRDEDAFKKGHILDSLSIKGEQLVANKLGKYKNKTLIFVCERGLQSPALATKLRAEGYQCMVLKGGLLAWQNADLPLVKGK